MNKKIISSILIVIAILLIINTYMHKLNEDKYIEIISAQQGSCFLEDGTCLHGERSYTNIVFQIILAVLLAGLGASTYYFDSKQIEVAKSIEETSKNIAKIKENESKNKEFEAFLSTFKEDEKTVLKAIQENEGVQQSTLRFKVNMSKAGLSLLLKSLEERGFIKREPYKKTNKIYLIKKF